MTNIVQYGSYNPFAFSAPGITTQILPPSQLLINGVPTNQIGVDGTAIWGPVNSRVLVGGIQDYVQKFGAIQARKYDMGTQVATAAMQGANNFYCVRVADGSQTTATASVLDTASATGLTLTAMYTGTLGNFLQATVSAGSKNNTYKITIALPNLAPETFDNISGTGNALWVNFAAAINTGQSSIRSASALVVATAGSSTALPALASVTAAGGTDGATTITGATLLGSDAATPKTGLYALRGSNCGIVVLADCDSSTTFSAQAAYGLGEGAFMIGVDVAGQTIAQTIATKNTAGIDNYSFKLLLGDWVYWFDSINNATRLVSPQGFVAGLLANLGPQYSSLNQQIFGIVSTQRSLSKQPYQSTEVSLMTQNGLDAILNPPPNIPNINYWATATGQNTSSNLLTNDDNYTRVTNFLALTFANGMGKYIGRLNSPEVQAQAANTISSFLQNLKGSVIKDFRTAVLNGPNPYTLVLSIRIVGYFTIRNILLNLQTGNTQLVSIEPVFPQQ